MLLYTYSTGIQKHLSKFINESYYKLFYCKHIVFLYNIYIEMLDALQLA